MRRWWRYSWKTRFAVVGLAKLTVLLGPIGLLFALMLMSDRKVDVPAVSSIDSAESEPIAFVFEDSMINYDDLASDLSGTEADANNSESGTEQTLAAEEERHMQMMATNMLLKPRTSGFLFSSESQRVITDLTDE